MQIRGLALQVMGQIVNGWFQAHLHLSGKEMSFQGP